MPACARGRGKFSGTRFPCKQSRRAFANRAANFRALLHRQVREVRAPLPASVRPILPWAFVPFKVTCLPLRLCLAVPMTTIPVLCSALGGALHCDIPLLVHVEGRSSQCCARCWPKPAFGALLHKPTSRMVVCSKSLSGMLASDLPTFCQKPKLLSEGQPTADLHGVCNVKEHFRGNAPLGCHQVAQMSRRLYATLVPIFLNGQNYFLRQQRRKSLSCPKW